MAVPTNTVQTFAMVGIREDLSDVISNIAPMDTTFYSTVRKGKAKNRSPEWLKDSLANPDPTNANIEGDDVTADASQQPTRLKNYVQLFDKVVSVSSTAQAVDTAGREDELKYQTAKRGKEIKRDMEQRFLGNYASVVGAAGTAGQCAGVEAWLTTNVDRGATGANGGFQVGTGLVTAATDGTARPFTEALLKSVLKRIWDAGGDPSMVLMSGTKKQTASAFAGIATQYRDNPQAKPVSILGAAAIYISDFGELKLVANRYVGAAAARTPTNGLYPGQTALILDPAKWEIAFLQPFKTENLAKTGHNDKKLLSAEVTLKSIDEAGNGAVADLS